MSDRSAWIVAPVRTPIGKFGGAFTDVPASDLGGAAARETLRRSGIDPKAVGEVIIGHGRQAGNRPNPARQVQWKCGIPRETPAYTVNKACASSLKAITLAAGAVRLGEQEVVLVGGQENMSRTPFYLERARWGLRLGHGEVTDGMYLDGFLCPLCDELMGATAENLAGRYGLDRAVQDAWAVETQRRCEEATKAGRFDAERIPVEIPGRKGPTSMNVDEHARPGTTLEGMAKLPPVFRKNGTVHAGNSSGITDGAATMLVASGDAVKAHGLRPMARLVDWTAAGVDPAIMGIGPVPAVRSLLARNRITLGDVDLVELNEAFAAQILACAKDLELDMAKVNVNGGAIALGHPIGATGARIVTTLLHEMERRGSKRGIATLCVSGGMGMALLFERE
ncbi:MAG: thiolase family protein [Planctomycetes bacterium]|nr:thiolase family protein [Planctomycetota bacterium]